VQFDTVLQVEATIDFGAAVGQPVAARTFSLDLRGTAGPRRGRPGAPTTEVRFVRPPDAVSSELARRVSSGERIATVDVQLPSGSGMPAVNLHLYDVQVVSTRLLLSDADVSLVQQRLALLESIAQLGADVHEADRQLSATESLAKQQLSPSAELARARARAEVLAKRLIVQERRLAIVEQQLARWSPTQEEVVLVAARMKLENR
jgi:hypothetical protein